MLWFPVKDLPLGLPTATRVLASAQWAVQYVCVPTHICEHYLFSVCALLESMIFTYGAKIFITNFTILSLHSWGIKYTHIVQTLQSIARIFSSSPTPHLPAQPLLFYLVSESDCSGNLTQMVSCLSSLAYLLYVKLHPYCSVSESPSFFQTEYFIIWIYHI